MKLLYAVLLLLASGLLAGCGTPAQSLQMGVDEVDALQIRGWMPEALRGQVLIGAVDGGADTGRWWGSKVSNAALAHALEDSLRAVGLLSLNAQQGSRFQLRAQLQVLDQPLVSLDTTVNAIVDYRLIDTSTGSIVYQRRVRTAYTADFGEAVISQPERIRQANQGAIRQTINLMLRDLPLLKL